MSLGQPGEAARRRWHAWPAPGGGKRRGLARPPHVGAEHGQAAKHLPPWKEIFAERGVRLRCPNIGCRAILITAWSGYDGTPFTEGWERQTVC
jgi:hypothetical protein